MLVYLYYKIMGTRHYQMVIDKEGNKKLAQYGQWDGYPSGQGVDILNYLRSGNLVKYQEELAKLKPITDKQSKVVDATINWPKEYPYLSRDCGARIHKMIEDGNVPFVGLMSKEEADQWCEGFYTIDFQKNIFSTEYHEWVKEYPLDNLPTPEEYLAEYKKQTGEE